MRNRPRDKKIDENFNVKLEFKPVDGDFHVKINFSKPIVMEEELFYKLNAMIRAVIQRKGEDAIEHISSDVEDYLANKLKNQEGVYFDSEIDSDYYEDMNDPVVLDSQSGDIQEVQVDKLN